MKRKVAFAYNVPINYDDPLIYVNRAAKQLQESIQRLLDAQSEGLLAGLGSDQRGDIRSDGSLTPKTGTPTQSSAGRTNQDIASSAWSARPKKTVPVRQPPKKTITLQSARNGLSKTMEEFASLKDEESQILESRLHERRTLLQRLDTFEAKEASIKHEITLIESGDENTSIQALRSQGQSLHQEIQDLELKLQELRNRHHYIQNLIRERESTVSSKLSSYEGSISLLRSDIQSFLRRPPPPPLPNNSNQSTFYALNPRRRTIQIARDCWTEEVSQLQERKDAAEADRAALQEGQELWQTTAQELAVFEKSLQTKMAQSNSAQDQEAEMGTVLKQMDAMIDTLSTKHQHATSRKWNLLVVALGAELEAFKEGRFLLRDAAGLPPESDEANGNTDLIGRQEDAEEDAEEEGAALNQIDPLQGTVEDGRGPAAAGNSGGGGVSDSENDEPGPEFLVSHADLGG